MLNFDFLEKGVGISAQYILKENEKRFLTLYSINRNLCVLGYWTIYVLQLFVF